MTPQNQMNPMGLDAQGSANMVGGLSAPAMSATETPTAPQENPAETTLRMILQKFQGAWTQLEDLNGSYSGDSDKFRAMQKAAEDWLASIAQTAPASSQQQY